MLKKRLDPCLHHDPDSTPWPLCSLLSWSDSINRLKFDFCGCCLGLPEKKEMSSYEIFNARTFILFLDIVESIFLKI